MSSEGKGTKTAALEDLWEEMTRALPDAEISPETSRTLKSRIASVKESLKRENEVVATEAPPMYERITDGNSIYGTSWTKPEPSERYSSVFSYSHVKEHSDSAGSQPRSPSSDDPEQPSNVWGRLFFVNEDENTSDATVELTERVEPFADDQLPDGEAYFQIIKTGLEATIDRTCDDQEVSVNGRYLGVGEQERLPSGSKIEVGDVKMCFIHHEWDNQVISEVGEDANLILKEVIGQGACAEVRRAVIHGSEVAMKILRLETHEERAGAIKEARLLAEMENHDGFVQVTDVLETSLAVLIGQELMTEGSLDDLIDERRRAGEPFTDLEIQVVAIQCANSALYMHNLRIVHRDLKPGNILIRNKVALKTAWNDFGFAKLFSCMGPAAQTICGTNSFAAPEIRMKYDHRADIWSIGAILFLMCTRRVPYPGAKDFKKPSHPVVFSRAQWKDRCPELLDFIQRLLAYNLDDRPFAREVCSHPFLRMRL